MSRYTSDGKEVKDVFGCLDPSQGRFDMLKTAGQNLWATYIVRSLSICWNIADCDLKQQPSVQILMDFHEA